MSSPEKTKSSDKTSLLISRKTLDLAVPPVTPSPKKGNGSDDRFTNKASLSDERKPSSLMVLPVAMSIPKTQSNNGEHTLIPVMVKMIHLTVSKGNRFFLKDGRPLHMAKLAGAVLNYDEDTKNIKIILEDGTGIVKVILWHNQKECSVAVALYVHVKAKVIFA
jgi:hypothetical protein